MFHEHMTQHAHVQQQNSPSFFTLIMHTFIHQQYHHHLHVIIQQHKSIHAITTSHHQHLACISSTQKTSSHPISLYFIRIHMITRRS